MIQGDTIDIPKVPKKMLHHCQNLNKIVYRIPPNKRRAPNMRHPPISATPLGIHIKISAPLISATPPITTLIRIVTIFY